MKQFTVIAQDLRQTADFYGAGSLVCAWARHLGATVVSTVSSEANA